MRLKLETLDDVDIITYGCSAHMAIPNIKEQVVQVVKYLQTIILLLQNTKQKKDYDS